MTNRNENRATFPSHTPWLFGFYDWMQAVPLLRGLFASRHACSLSCDAEPQKGAPIFVAVHGTWATRAAWTRPNSNLLMELAKQWPGAGIYRFKWSGTNGVRHRLVASDVLYEKLQHLIDRDHTSKVVTIAHSHGGNVVAWASTRLERPLSVAVYLNTPFIQALDSSSKFNLILRIILYLGGTIVLLPFAIAVQNLLFGSRRDDPHLIAFGLGLAIVAGGLALLQKYVPPKIHAIRDRLLSVSTSSRKICRELVALVAGDEPNSAFGAVYLAQWLGRRIAVALLFAIPASFVFSRLGVIAKGTVDRIVPYFIGCFLATYFAYLLFATSAYGVVQGLLAMDASIAVTPGPVGRTDLVTLPWTSRDRLRHSLVHESPEAIAAIVAWLTTVLPDDPPADPVLCETSG